MDIRIPLLSSPLARHSRHIVSEAQSITTLRMSGLSGARLPESWKFRPGRPDVTRDAAFSGDSRGDRYLAFRVSLASRLSRGRAACLIRQHSARDRESRDYTLLEDVKVVLRGLSQCSPGEVSAFAPADDA